MNKYYHFTSYNCLDNIGYYGLVPQTGFRSKSIDDNRCAVFLAKGMDKAINMYSLLLTLYIQQSGENGLRLIQEYDNSINRLSKAINYGGSSEQMINSLNALKEKKEMIKQVYNCNNFTEYLGGEGCFLSVSGIDNIVLDNSQECFCDKTIPPSNISILVLQNKITNEIIDSREAVLSYFMSYYSPYDFALNPINEDSVSSINYLYKLRDDYNYTYFNENNYNLLEVPLELYNYKIKKIRPLIFN